MSLQPNPWLQTLGKYHHLDETELEHRPQAAGAALTAEDISSTDEYFFGEGNNTSSAAPSTKSFLDFDFEEEFQDVSPLPEGESLILPRLLMLGHWLLLSGKACMFLNCPCCLGRPCTSEKRAEYKRMTKTFVLSITVLQVSVVARVRAAAGRVLWCDQSLDRRGLMPKENTLVGRMPECASLPSSPFLRRKTPAMMALNSLVLSYP
mmetsp:Transcript_16386/g.41986  ORF Transcript_16386/g.41986 Transcript_16386/m.41986 type:complete len:207 (+) Transcript_16386:140-760(+)